MFVTIPILRENGYGIDGQWHHAIKFARWQHLAPQRGARFLVPDNTRRRTIIFAQIKKAIKTDRQ